MTTLTVNGKKHKITADEDMPLLWVLRDILQLKGTKFGCGKALCGACTVLLNGSAVRSCSLPLSAVSDGDVVTIEGLHQLEETDTGLHPLQQAWIDENVPQCGYCQAGQIMSAAALLNQTDSIPTDKKIDKAMSGNICRCGTYPRIRRAIKRAAFIRKGQ